MEKTRKAVADVTEIAELKCPFLTNKKVKYDGNVKVITEEFGDCAMNLCPFYKIGPIRCLRTEDDINDSVDSLSDDEIDAKIL